MATFGQIITRVSSRLKDPNNVEIQRSDVANVINEAIKYYAREHFIFNEFQETIALIEENPEVPSLPFGVEYLFQEGGFTIDYAKTRWQVDRVNTLEYDQMNVEGRGIPFAYTQRNNGFEVYYYPDSNYSAILRGVKKYDDFAIDGSEDNDTNDFTIHAFDLITYESLSRLFAEEKLDPKMEGYYSARAKDQYDSLVQVKNMNKSTGRIQIQEF